MRIIMTCQYYWPDNFLINEIAEDLVKKGHKVTVLTGLPDYTTTKIPNEYKFFRRRHEFHNGVEIVRVPIIARHHGFIMRVFNYLSYYVSSSIYARTHNFSNYDLIYAYQLAPILMVNPGVIIKKRYKIPMFMYVLDLWPDQMKIWHVKENNPLFKIMLKYSRKAYNCGDIVGITSEPFEKYLIDVCKVDSAKIIYLPQHSDKLKITSKQIRKEKDKKDLIFAGNIGKQQNLECLIKAISLMKHSERINVHIYGEGTDFLKCKEYTNKLKLNDIITFYGRVPKEKLANIYSKMDAFLLTLCSEKEIGYAANTVPAKLQNYMSAGKPILASIDGGAYDIINKSGCGTAVHSGDCSAYANLLDDFVCNQIKYKDCGKKAIDYFNKHFEKEKVLKRHEDILNELLKRKK